MMAGVEMVNLRGLDTGFLREGQATDAERRPIVLCLHGFPDDPTVWDGMSTALREYAEVVRPYARGVGPSVASSEGARYGVQASTLDWLALLDHVDPTHRREVICLGHDLGAVQALALAPLLGDRLKGLVIFDGLSLRQMMRRWRRRPAQLRRSWYIGAFQMPFAAELIAKLPKRVAERLVPAHVRLARAAWREPMRAYRALLREAWASVRGRDPRLQAKLLVIWGLHDPFLERTTLGEWRDVSGDTTVRVLPCGHWPMLELPTVSERYVAEFFHAVVTPAGKPSAGGATGSQVA